MDRRTGQVAQRGIAVGGQGEREAACVRTVISLAAPWKAQDSTTAGSAPARRGGDADRFRAQDAVPNRVCAADEPGDEVCRGR